MPLSQNVSFLPPFRSLKFQTVLEHPLEHLLALVHEFDLIVTWNK